MKRQQTTVPVPWPVQRLCIVGHSVRIRSEKEELMLTLRDEKHVEQFLTAFSEAWMRWDEKEDTQDSSLDELQQALPF